MQTRNARLAGLILTTAGVATILLVHWMVVYWVPTEAVQGIVQRIFYVHVPAAWTTFLAFGIVALASAAYLWLEDERADSAAVAAAEGGLVFGAIMLTSGPLWGRIAWGTYWTWEPRLTLTLLLWFTYLGYFLIRGSVANPRRGKRFAAVVAIVGSLNIPLIHVSVTWFRSLHPGPVVIKPDGADPAPGHARHAADIAGGIHHVVPRTLLPSLQHRTPAPEAGAERGATRQRGVDMTWASIVSFAGIGAAEFLLLGQSGGDGVPSLRPYVHVFIAYGLAWVIVLFWVWRIWRGLKGLGGSD